MIFIDYMTVSLGKHIALSHMSTLDVIDDFASILPKLFLDTSKEAVCSEGKSKRISQYGITSSEQYGTGKERGWLFSVQLSGNYWQAIERDKESVLQILSHYITWQLSRLDLACDVCVPLDEWQDFVQKAFNTGLHIAGAGDAITVYYGSRISQFYTRVYNKTAEDTRHYPASDGFVVIRFEIEIKKVRGELVFDHIFKHDNMTHLFNQRVMRTSMCDSSGFIAQHFQKLDNTEKIQTVKRELGNLESSVDYVMNTYKDYFTAGMQSQSVVDRFLNNNEISAKSKKILAVMDAKEEGGYSTDEHTANN